jgi:NAD(P)-dependent dehydrogenase (short-subunit alcohol dehydrogenase family)
MVAKHVTKYISPGPNSSITLTTGALSEKPMFGAATASGLAASLPGLVRGLALDMAPVRVNAISPGLVTTPLLAGFSPQMIEMSKKAGTTGTIGAPEDVAEAYLYCMKDKFVTGSVISTNGGWLLK